MRGAKQEEKVKEYKVRLQKYLSECGIASRRKAEEYIAAGRVKVNGRVASIGDKVDPKHDKIVFAGKRIINQTKKMYIMLHKPRGYVTTTADEMDRKCVTDLIADAGQKLYPVGRLDKDSEGLLLMTNDGEFTNLLTHPSRHVSKTYRVTVRGKVNEEHLTQLSSGVVIDGERTSPCDVHVISRGEDRTVLGFVLYQGKNRQIRKMCEVVGLNVIRLKRTMIAGVKLGMLPPGKWRDLNEKELRHLMNVSIPGKEDE